MGRNGWKFGVLVVGMVMRMKVFSVMILIVISVVLILVDLDVFMINSRVIMMEIRKVSRLKLLLV